MSLSLITDRTSTDTSRRAALRAKIKDRTATSAEWSEWLSPLKGAYNAADLNRVGQAIQYLADLLNSYGYSATISPKTDWVISDIPRAADVTQYIADLNTLKNAFYGTTELPDSMNNLTVTAANNIEKLLLEIEDYITNMAAAFVYSGEVYSGEV